MTRPTRGYLVAGAALVVVLALAWWVRGAPPPIDVRVHDWSHRTMVAHPRWLTAFSWLTNLGATWTLIAVAAILAWVYRRRPGWPSFPLIATALSIVLFQLGKAVIGRPRPAYRFWDTVGQAFPSGHSSSSAVLAGLILFLAWPSGRHRGWLVAAVAALPLLVGVTRVMGGVHWPSDVLAGWLVGVAAVAIGYALTIARSGPAPAGKLE